MTNKKLSIITINYNNLEGLIRTIESVVNQTFQEFEYTVIDGGSIDGSAEYIKSQSEKIDYWISEPDNGIYNAMNKGIVKAKGEFLLFLNSGDVFDNFDVLLNLSKENLTGNIICGNLYKVGKKNEKLLIPPKDISLIYLFEYGLPHPSMLIARSLFEQYGLYREDYSIISDWCFYFNLQHMKVLNYQKLELNVSKFNTEGISSSENGIKLQKIERDLFFKEIYNEEIIMILYDYIKVNKELDNIKKSRWVNKLLFFLAKFQSIKTIFAKLYSFK
jgi:glycosyltransferase involved in cell wall biosynthesis